MAGSRRRIAVTAAAAALVLTITGAAAAGVFSGPAAGARTATGARTAASGAGTAGSAGTAASGPHSAGSAASRTGAGAAKAAAPAAARHVRTADRIRARGPRTSCRSVAHIGDSTSLDLISPLDLANPAQRLAARYHDVGVRHVRISASGGRSVVEVLPGQVNGYNVAREWRSEGYRGCWVFALGTNDTANVAVGSGVGLMARIERMMSAAHGEPVLWVNTRTMLSRGPWAQSNEQAWDNTLVEALRLYPNMRILNWAAMAKPGWFLPDGIHYNAAGRVHRAEAIARGLARAFPLDGHSRGRVVS